MSLSPDVQAALETHLGHSVSGTPFSILSTHLSAMPPGLARAVGSSIPPRDRTRIPAIRRRRHLHAHRTPRPSLLSAEQGRLRWPLLWERLGGDPRAPVTAAQREESAWADNEFTPGRERFVGRLGRMLAEEEEVREWQAAREARARERQLDNQGEEFDDSDDEDAQPSTAPNTGAGDANQREVVTAFERQLLELFLDGLDTIDYDDVDFSEAPDPIAERDEEEAWFDDEEPTQAANGSSSASRLMPNGSMANGAGASASVNGGRLISENGQGEYDY